MRNLKSHTSINASVQLLEVPKEGRFNKALPSKEILEVWCNADVVCFDVDSTVCLDEGIDEHAEFCGAGKAVVEWTTRISRGIDELVKKMKARNTDVYIISGGFRRMINPVASILGIPVDGATDLEAKKCSSCLV
ncbi:phosphoserine phosphatase, chloroplastic-like [Coffea eugenioides]|uniref:phosphoserine phosphatase, chloroplastic-like n=1 Tax=Coffea eugenioides TaxID=49369 RepID=UPI000F6120F3|nr:phosphoserine phosphatase, chloroplastic-like [Coffea eugenioides]